ncbi:MAG: Uma2 family endonuclease [Planctomycetes bacterium]|nr:Uma2 family endonuclease [Planctomycetota bacterium]
MSTLSTIILQPDGIRIPRSVTDLESFRRWVHSDRFPEKGRIDWIGGRLEVDISPENLDRHGTLKSAIARDLGYLIERPDLGVVLVDSSRYTCLEAGLSVEPDILVVLFESIDAGRVRLVPAARGEGYVEVQGSADLVVECVSDSSRMKDLRVLPPRYHQAGVREYWIADARKATASLKILARAPGAYREVPADRSGFHRSAVLGGAVRLVRLPERSGLVRYVLERRGR